MAVTIVAGSHAVSAVCAPGHGLHHVGLPQLDELYLLNGASTYETNNQLNVQPQLAAEMLQAIIAQAGPDPFFGYLPLTSG